MINSALEELFNSIENSKFYQEYKKMAQILDKDKEILELIEEIKKLEKEATYLENNQDPRYHEVDEEIKRKSDILNNKQVYVEYLEKMEEFNQELATSSYMIEKYIDTKV